MERTIHKLEGEKRLVEAQAEKDIQVIRCEAEAAKVAAARETAALREAEHRSSLLKQELAELKLAAVKEGFREDGIEKVVPEAKNNGGQTYSEAAMEFEGPTGSEQRLAIEVTRLQQEVSQLKEELALRQAAPALEQQSQSTQWEDELGAEVSKKQSLGVFDPSNWVDEAERPIESVSREAIESELTAEDRQRGNRIFQAMNQDHGGILDIEELLHSFSILNKADANVMFAVLNENRDAEISPQEWEQYLVIKKREKKSKRFLVFLDFLEDTLSKCDKQGGQILRGTQSQSHTTDLGDIITSARSIYDAADEEKRETMGDGHRPGALTRCDLNEFVLHKEGLEIYFSTLMDRELLAEGLASYGRGQDGGHGTLMPREEFAGFFVAAALRALRQTW